MSAILAALRLLADCRNLHQSSLSARIGAAISMDQVMQCAYEMAVNSVNELLVWKRSMELAQLVYKLVATISDDERFGLTSQLRRAAVSIPSNIAEGWGYGRTGRYLHHLRIARGSERELMTQLELAMRLNLARAEIVKPALEQANEVGRMLTGLIRSLEQSESKPSS